MLKLKDLPLSDLMLRDRVITIRRDNQIFPLPEECQEDADQLFGRLKQTNPSVTGFTVNYDGVRYRVERTQTVAGVSFCLRRLQPNISRWSSLGHAPQVLSVLLGGQGAQIRRGGIILVSGSVDSGKSTTSNSLVYEFLSQVPWRCVTIEDPVETLFPEVLEETGAEVIQCDAPAGGFAGALRSALRMGADLIMVGEIRDGDAAHTAIEAALTGHTVVTTLHASDMVSGISRFVATLPGGWDDQKNRMNFAGAFRGAIYQRLSTMPGVMRGRILTAEYLVDDQSVSTKLANGQTERLQSDIEAQTTKLRRGEPITGG